MYLVLIIALVLLYITYRIIRKQQLTLPPGPPISSLPIFGHLLSLGKHPQETLMKWCQVRQSDIIHCYFGQKLVIVLNNHSLIKPRLFSMRIILLVLNHLSSKNIFMVKV